MSRTGVEWPIARTATRLVPRGNGATNAISSRAPCTTCIQGQVHAPRAQQSLSQSAGWLAGGDVGGVTGADAVGALWAWPQAAFSDCASASVITIIASCDEADMAGIAIAAMALPIPLRSRHRAKSRRRVMRDMVTGYDRARACHVKKTFKTTRPSGKASKSLAGMPTAGHIPCNLGLGSCSKCSEELPWRRTPAMSSAIARIPKS